jgi:oligopeptide transport system substrate-binding protein
MMLMSWAADFPDPDSFLSLFLSDSGNNPTGWKNATYDKLVLEARRTTRKSEREKKYAEAQRMLIERDVAIVPLFHGENRVFVKPAVSGVHFNPLNGIEFQRIRFH